MTSTTTLARSFPRFDAAASLGVVHRSGALRDSLSRLPEWAATLDQLTRLDMAAGAPRPNIGSTTENLAALITEALAGGGDLPADLTEQAARIKAEVDARTETAHALEKVRSDLTGRLDRIVRENVGTLYRHLNEELQAVLTETRALGDLADIGTAEAAIDSDRGEDYRTLVALEARYAGVRSAQSILTRNVSGDTAPRFPELVHMPDPVAVFPDLFDWRARGYVTDERTGERRKVSPPWPVDLTPAAHPDRGGAMLRWAAESGAALWVPTMKQLKEAGATLHDRFAPEPVSLGRAGR